MTNCIKLSGTIGAIATRVEDGREVVAFALVFENDSAIEVIVSDRSLLRHVPMTVGKHIEVRGCLRFREGGIPYIECCAAFNYTIPKSTKVTGVQKCLRD
jgi:hypothetical protein